MQALGQLLVASGNAAKTLQAVDQALYSIPLSVSLLVERLASPLMTLTRDDAPDVSPPQIAPDLAAVVAHVGYHPLRALC